MNKKVKYLVNIIKNNIGAVAFINLVLAGTALLKDIFLAAYLGTSHEADALTLAFFLPDSIGNNLFAASVATASIPILSALLEKKDLRRFNAAIRNIILFVIAVSSFLALLFAFFKTPVINTLGKGLGSNVKILCMNLFIVLLPTFILFPVAATGYAVMNSKNRFKLPAFVPVLFNAILLGAVLYGYILHIPPGKGVYIIASFITIAVLAMVLIIWLPLLVKASKNTAVSKVFSLSYPSPSDIYDMKKILRLFLPYLFMLTVTQGVQYFERYLASGFDRGSITALNYAYRLSQFPVWVFVSAVSTVILPSLSKAQSTGHVEEMKASFSNHLRLIIAVTMPISILFNIMRVPIVTVLLKHGAFNTDSLHLTTALLSGFSLSILGQSVVFISIRAFLASGSMHEPLSVFLFSAILNVVCDYYLVRKMGLAGIGYGAAIASFSNLLLVFRLLKKRLYIDTNSYSSTFLLKIFVSNIPPAVILLLSLKLCNYLPEHNSFFAEIALLIVAAVFYSVAYYIFLHIANTKFVIYNEKGGKC